MQDALRPAHASGRRVGGPQLDARRRRSARAPSTRLNSRDDHRPPRRSTLTRHVVGREGDEVARPSRAARSRCDVLRLPRRSIGSVVDLLQVAPPCSPGPLTSTLSGATVRFGDRIAQRPASPARSTRTGTRRADQRARRAPSGAPARAARPSAAAAARAGPCRRSARCARRPGVDARRGRARSRAARSSTPSRIVRGPRSVTVDGLRRAGWSRSGPAASFRSSTGSSTIALGVALADVDREPEDEREQQRDELEPGFRRRPRAGLRRGRRSHAPRRRRAAGASAPRRRRRTAVRSAGASSDQQLLQRACAASPASTSRVILPSRTSEIVPSSSETTMTTRVGLLGEADGGAVARAERLADVRVGGERQEAARRR